MGLSKREIEELQADDTELNSTLPVYQSKGGFWSNGDGEIIEESLKPGFGPHEYSDEIRKLDD